MGSGCQPAPRPSSVSPACSCARDGARQPGHFSHRSFSSHHHALNPIDAELCLHRALLCCPPPHMMPHPWCPPRSPPEGSVDHQEGQQGHAGHGTANHQRHRRAARGVHGLGGCRDKQEWLSLALHGCSLPAPTLGPSTLPPSWGPPELRRGVSGSGGAAKAPSRGPVPISMPTGDAGRIAMG